MDTYVTKNISLFFSAFNSSDNEVMTENVAYTQGVKPTGR